MAGTLTKGLVTRNSKELQNQSKETQRRIDAQNKHIQDINNQKLLSNYKKIVYEAFINQFANNYGDSFDYDSLLNSITFSTVLDKNGNASFSFKFNENNVIFRSDAKQQCQEFNSNSYQDFVSNEDMIDSNVLAARSGSQDYYDNMDEDSQIENDYDGIFIPISDNRDRYGEFNKINKLAGYTPINISGAEAAKIANSNWSKFK